MRDTIIGLFVLGGLMWFGAMIQMATRLADHDQRLSTVEALCGKTMDRAP